MSLVVRIRFVVVHYIIPFTDVYYARFVCAGLFFARTRIPGVTGTEGLPAGRTSASFTGVLL